MGQLSKSYTADFTSDGSAQVFNLAYLPRSVFFMNKTAQGGTTNNDVRRAWGYSSDDNGTAHVVYSAGSAADNSTTITSGGFSFVTRDTPRFGASKAITAITKAANAQVTVTAHGYQVGDTVLINNTDNMDNIGGLIFRVASVVDANNFTIPFNTNTANFTAATSGSVKQVLYPDLYIPFGCITANVSQAASAVVSTCVEHQFVVGQRVKFQGFANFGMVEIEGKEAYVTAVGTTSVTVDLDTSGYSAFAWPAPAVISAGSDFPQIYSIGDQNFGFIGPTPPTPLGIPGAFSANTGYQVIVGVGDGTRVMHASNDVCTVQFEWPDQLGDSIPV